MLKVKNKSFRSLLLVFISVLFSFLLIKLFDGQNRVFTYKEAIKNEEMKKKLVPKYIFLDEPDVIYGLYSRHGYSYAPKIPGPEFNINEIKYNFFF